MYAARQAGESGHGQQSCTRGGHLDPLLARLCLHSGSLLPDIAPVPGVYSGFSFPIVPLDTVPTSRFITKAAGAGALLDQGVYALTWADATMQTTAPGAVAKGYILRLCLLSKSWRGW